MADTVHLLTRFAPAIGKLELEKVAHLTEVNDLLLHSTTIGGRRVDMIYAPFDHINRAARIVIVGMTPGQFQAINALKSAKAELANGKDVGAAAEVAKLFASFSGEPMRSNLVRMLDKIGVARHLGLTSTSDLWAGAASQVHFTSALRYPVFVDGQNWSGQPDMVRNAVMRGWLETYTGEELRELSDALIVPLGPKVSAAMDHLARQGVINPRQLLTGLPHPSGANAERIASFLGEKPDARCSSKTNPVALRAARNRLLSQVESLRRV